MKAINVLLIISLFYAIYSDDPKYCEDYGPSFRGTGEKQAFSLDFCRTTAMKDSSTYAKCCFMKWKTSNDEKREYNCYPIKTSELVEIDETIDLIESTYSSIIDEIVSLDCGSSYLYGALLLILVLLF